jgi:hypothetical protein
VAPAKRRPSRRRSWRRSLGRIRAEAHGAAADDTAAPDRTQPVGGVPALAGAGEALRKQRLFRLNALQIRKLREG